MRSQINEAAEIANRLRKRLDDCSPVFVLIDPLLGEPPTPVPISDGNSDTSSLRYLLWNRPVAPIRLCRSTRLRQDQHPYLVELSDPSDPLLEFTVEVALDERSQAMAYGLGGMGGAPHRIGAWLQSDSSVSQVANLIAGMCTHHSAAATAPRYLRIIDRRTMAFLRHLAGDTRVAAHISGLRNWCYLDMTGDTDSIEGDGPARTALEFSKEEWSHLRNGEGIHRTLHQWMGELEITMANVEFIEPNKAYLSATRGFADASKLAIDRPQYFKTLADITTWAAMSLAYPEIANGRFISRQLAHPENEPANTICSMYPHLIDAVKALQAEFKATTTGEHP